jgi:hypothetical protein
VCHHLVPIEGQKENNISGREMKKTYNVAIVLLLTFSLLIAATTHVIPVVKA